MSVGAAFGASAIALDNVFEAAGRKRDLASTEEIYSLWALIYAVRNAFAHAITAPAWVVKEKYQREIELALDGYNGIIEVNRFIALCGTA